MTGALSVYALSLRKDDLKMGSQFSRDQRCYRSIVGDISTLSKEDQKIYKLSYLALKKEDDLIGKVIPHLGIKVVDTKINRYEEQSRNNSSAEHDIDNEECKSLTAVDANDVSVSDKHQASLEEEHSSVHSLFCILVTEKPVCFSQSFSVWKTLHTQNNLFTCCGPDKRTIYIQPVDTFPAFITKSNIELNDAHELYNLFTLLQVFAKTFFRGMNVRLRQSISITAQKWKINTRNHHKTGEKQYFVKDFLRNLGRVIPPEGFCIMGISWTDLYPTEDLNFVLGEANYATKSGVFCFGRFEPKSYDPSTHEDITELDGKVLWRVLKVFSHEMCHLFGLQHCWYFHCAMNESNSMAEAASQPLFLCPVCLRKLQHVCNFDIITRYKKLLELLTKICVQFPSPEFRNSVTWLEKCIQFLESEENVV